MAAQKVIGVIGLGSMGLRHAKNLQAMGYHVWGTDPDMSKRLELGFDYTAPTFKELLTADAFVIASPTNKHFEHILATTVMDKPCFVEKPISHTPLPEISSVTMVGYNLVYHSCVKSAKEWMDQGLIGEPIWANLTCAQYNDKPAYLRDGVVLNWSHEIHLALYLLGPAKVKSSNTRLVNGHDDMTDINLTHENGCQSAIHLDYLTLPEIRQSVIVGTKATIIMDLVNRQAWLRSSTGTIIDHVAGADTWDDNYIEEMEAFLARIDGKDVPGCTGEEALKVLEICLEVRKQAGL